MNKLFEKFKYLYPDQLDEAIIKACIDGNVDEVDYLVTSFELKVHTNLGKEFNEAFDFACVNGHLPVVKYLINCPELENHINNDNIKDGFQSACYYRKMDIVNYLIMDFNIELNDEIKGFLNLPNENIEPINIFKNHKDSFKEALNVFEARELEKQLNTIGNNKKEKKPKI
jgi:ankyrin repeat protein